MKPFYDPLKTYIKNYEEGPFNAFADGKDFRQKGKPQHKFLGENVFMSFGIPAGPLLNSKFIKGAFEKGFDMCVYKTVRTSVFPCHPYPNLLAIHKDKILISDLDKPIGTDRKFVDPLSITNSFGVPSKDPVIWQEDAKKAISYAKDGQIMILSFMGTPRSGQSESQFIDDFALAAKLANETGARVFEVNLSCPNIGCSGLVCYGLETTKKALRAIRKVIGSKPLIVKTGYFISEDQLEKFTKIAGEYGDAIAGINTLQGIIVGKNGLQALPGKERLKSGICGHGIKWAGIDTVKRLKQIREKNHMKFKIIGVGGVTVPQDYLDYTKAGADAVMSATGAMWNPSLALEIRDLINK
jgi:dihydroorotate dehydrogenase